MAIELVNESSININGGRTVALAQFVLTAMHVHPMVDLSIMFIDPDAMEKLHIRWMDEPGPTDVLSFPMDQLRPGTATAPSEPGMLGDVVVCPQIAEIQAKHAGHSALLEMDVLLTHGILHLLGFDHVEPDEREQMFSLQKELVAAYHDAGEPGA